MTIEGLSARVFASWRTSLLALAVFGTITYLLAIGVMGWEAGLLGYAGAFALLFRKERRVVRRAQLRKAQRDFDKALDDHEESGS